MECSLEANPLPDIVWYQGTKTIIDTDRVKMSRKAISKDTYVLTLEILNPTRDDGGNYRCNAFNIYGESNANIALNFQGKSINQSVIMSRKLSLFAVFILKCFKSLTITLIILFTHIHYSPHLCSHQKGHNSQLTFLLTFSSFIGKNSASFMHEF